MRERRNSSRRFPATAARYFAVERMSSMGLASEARAARAARMVESRFLGERLWPVRAASAAEQRTGRSAKEAAPRRMSAMMLPSSLARAARATLEMARALRVPTLRMYWR